MSRRRVIAAASSTPRVKLDALRLSLALLIVINVSRIHQRFTILQSLRPALVLICIAFLSALANPRALGRWHWERQWQARVIYGITIVTLGSIAFGISQGASFFMFKDYFSKVLIFAFLLMAAIRSARDLWVFAWAYLIGTGLLVWMALFVFNLSVGTNGFARLDNLETWDANDICVLLEMGLGFGLLLFQVSGRKGKIVAGTICLGIGAAIARSGSRGGFIGLAILLLAYLVSMPGVSPVRRLGLVAVLIGGVAIAAPAGYLAQMETISSVKSDYNWDADQGRRQLAIRGMKYMMSYPVFGLGVGNFGRAEAFISDLAKQRAEMGQGLKWSAPHNSYIEAGSELGIPGFLLFIGLVVGCIVAPWRLRRRIPREWEAGDWEQRVMFHAAKYLPLASIGFAVPAFFVSFAFLDPIYTLAAMTAALSGLVKLRLGVRRSNRRTAMVPLPAGGAR